MVLVAIGVFALGVGLYLFRTRSMSREMMEKERSTGKRTTVPGTALVSGYVFPLVGLFLIVVGLIQVL